MASPHDPGGADTYPAPPGGSPAPTTAPIPGGGELDLIPIARRACSAFLEESPDYAERYGPVAMPWCVHDNQHVLNWALGAHTDAAFERELAWLARVLEARGFPLEWLARGIELLAEPVRERDPDLAAVARRIEAGAGFLRSRPSFVD